MAAILDHVHDDVPDEIQKRLHFIEGDESDMDLKALYSSYGWFYIYKIFNNSDNVVHFKNPYNGKSGDIAVGDIENKNCQGYIPYYSHDDKYEISYFNVNKQERVKIYIKDLGGDWILSFYQEGKAEDIRAVRPALDSCYGGVDLTIYNDGYEIYETTSRCKKGRELFG